MSLPQRSSSQGPNTVFSNNAASNPMAPPLEKPKRGRGSRGGKSTTQSWTTQDFSNSVVTVPGGNAPLGLEENRTTLHLPDDIWGGGGGRGRESGGTQGVEDFPRPFAPGEGKVMRIMAQIIEEEVTGEITTKETSECRMEATRGTYYGGSYGGFYGKGYKGPDSGYGGYNRGLYQNFERNYPGGRGYDHFSQSHSLPGFIKDDRDSEKTRKSLLEGEADPATDFIKKRKRNFPKPPDPLVLKSHAKSQISATEEDFEEEEQAEFEHDPDADEEENEEENLGDEDSTLTSREYKFSRAVSRAVSRPVSPLPTRPASPDLVNSSLSKDAEDASEDAPEAANPANSKGRKSRANSTNDPTKLLFYTPQAKKERGEKGLHVEAGYIDKHKGDIIVFLYKSQSSFRNTLKRLAEPIVISQYGLPLPRDQEPNTGFNASQLGELTTAYMSKLLEKSFFLQDGRDANGQVNNFAHPCLKEVVKVLFYTGNKALAKTFPKDFGAEQFFDPFIFQIRYCISKYEDGPKPRTIDFTTASNLEYHRLYSDMITAMLGEPYHSSKFKTNLRSWVSSFGLEANLEQGKTTRMKHIDLS
ncbi:hypothetical protein F5877DRAFT_73251 [Lentinula edodes]|nr:hypothetical protein F5877DRAFT_73251 [Lentinula edodes]